MYTKKKLNILKSDNILSSILFLIALFVNQYYAGKGVFPVDSFFHFDPGYRILNGEYPVKDYWVVHGIFVDYLQSVFFYLFGVSWKSYVFHASVFNGALTAATYFIFRNFKLSKIYSSIYSFLFCILAYTSSGTPFLDHHSVFFSLLGIYSLILAIDKKKNLYWALLPVFLGCAFLSKQVPSSYVIVSVSFILFIYILKKKEFNPLKYVFIGSLFFILIIFLLGSIQGISLDLFLVQYIYFPSSIGLERFTDYKLTFKGIISHYKFIYLALLPIIYLNIKKIIKNISYVKEKKFYIFLILTMLTLSLIFHQILTKNQIFIFFLIPILTGFSHIYFKDTKIKNNNKNKIFIFIVIVCFLITFKYHLRFNENRKFHELSNVNFNSSVDATEIDKRLFGLNWISPVNKNPKVEISLANLAKKILKEEKKNKMVITDYQFFSALLGQQLNSPSRSFDTISYPGKNNKYFERYKSFLLNKVKKNNVEVIYLINFDLADENHILYDFINKNCLEKEIVSKQLKRFVLKKC